MPPSRGHWHRESSRTASYDATTNEHQRFHAPTRPRELRSRTSDEIRTTSDAEMAAGPLFPNNVGDLH